MVTTVSATCEHCRWWHDLGGNNVVHYLRDGVIEQTYRQGECRRRSPVFVVEDRPGREHRWPVTQEDEGCGDWQIDGKRWAERVKAEAESAS